MLSFFPMQIRRATKLCTIHLRWSKCSFLRSNWLVNSFRTITTSVPANSDANSGGKKLYTPGPLGVSRGVREAMLQDLGSRDTQFMETIVFIRKRLLEIAHVSDEKFTAIPLQGSGTYAVEGVFQTAVPQTNARVLILENGAYGKRMASICKTLKIPHDVLSFREDEAVDVAKVSKHLAEADLKNQKPYTLIAIVHCETSSGVFNPVEEVGKLIKNTNLETLYFVDAMSSFGAVPLDLNSSYVDFMVSSANKCLEGVPGFGYVLARKSVLKNCCGNSRSLSLDIIAQAQALESTGQFRFTPPTHTMLAFKQALLEYEAEGGLEGRAKRYKKNNEIIRNGMKKMGFQELLASRNQGYIITSFHYPDHKNFNFQTFYSLLNDKDLVIYPGKVLETNCFRIGNIGQLFEADMRKLLDAINDVLKAMKIPVPLK